MSEFPMPWVRIEYMLRTYGGWSRMFRRSREAVDKEVVIYRENEQGFWIEYAKALGEEQFRDTVEEAVTVFRATYSNKLPTRELRQRLAEQLLRTGWKPVKTRILKQIRDLRREKKEIIQCLRPKRK